MARSFNLGIFGIILNEYYHKEQGLSNESDQICPFKNLAAPEANYVEGQHNTIS
jgi:hypothetical protein